MQSLLQSAFLRSLGYAIANSLWQAALLWIVVVLVSYIGKLSSSKKYFIAAIGQFAGFVWFVFTVRFYYLRCQEFASEMQLSGAAGNNSANVFRPDIHNFSSAVLYILYKAEELLPYLSFAYLCMLLFLLIRFRKAFYFTDKIRSRGLQKADVELRLFVRKTAEYLGITKPINVYVSNLVKSPLTIGFIKPLILIPFASINHLTTEQLEAILLHELAHIKRGDYLINIIQSIIEIILFFNPFIQLIGRSVKQERENSCDDWVLQFQYNPAMYAEALLRIAFIQKQPGFAINATGSNKNDLLSRVKRMLNQQERTHGYRNQVFSLFVITILLSTLAWFQPIVKSKPIPPTISTFAKPQKIANVPGAPGFNNPLFNPIYFLAKPIQQELNKVVSVEEGKLTDAPVPVSYHQVNIRVPAPPVSLQRIQDVAIRESRDLQRQEAQELRNINIATKLNSLVKINLNDTMKMVSEFKNVFVNAMTNADLNKINIQLKNVEAQLASAAKEDYANTLSTPAVKQALKITSEQLGKIKTQTLYELKNSIESKTQEFLQKNQNIKIEETRERSKRMLGNVGKKEMKQWSDQINFDSLVNKALSLSELSDENPEDASSLYTPVGYNIDGSYDIADSNGIRSAIIVIKHDPANEHSHTKHITVSITTNNGLQKNYELAVEVYQ
jgi:beta-lactamase regulating signal transducer with metallopeptidase domain